MNIAEMGAAGQELVDHQGHPPFRQDLCGFRNRAKLTVAHEAILSGAAAPSTTHSGLERFRGRTLSSLVAHGRPHASDRARNQREVAMKAFGWKTVAWQGGAVAAALAGVMMTGTASAQALR